MCRSTSTKPITASRSACSMSCTPAAPSASPPMPAKVRSGRGRAKRRDHRGRVQVAGGLAGDDEDFAHAGRAARSARGSHGARACRAVPAACARSRRRCGARSPARRARRGRSPPPASARGTASTKLRNSRRSGSPSGACSGMRSTNASSASGALASCGQVHVAAQAVEHRRRRPRGRARGSRCAGRGGASACARATRGWR